VARGARKPSQAPRRIETKAQAPAQPHDLPRGKRRSRNSCGMSGPTRSRASSRPRNRHAAGPRERPARNRRAYFVAAGASTSSLNVPGTMGGRGRGMSAVGAGAGPNSAVTVYTRWLTGSSAIVRARAAVGTFWSTV